MNVLAIAAAIVLALSLAGAIVLFACGGWALGLAGLVVALVGIKVGVELLAALAGDALARLVRR